MDMTSLPGELLQLIADHLRDDVPSLRNLCLVSNAWNSAAKPVLFYELTLDEETSLDDLERLRDPIFNRCVRKVTVDASLTVSGEKSSLSVISQKLSNLHTISMRLDYPTRVHDRGQRADFYDNWDRHLATLVEDLVRRAKPSAASTGGNTRPIRSLTISSIQDSWVDLMASDECVSTGLRYLQHLHLYVKLNYVHGPHLDDVECTKTTRRLPSRLTRGLLLPISSNILSLSLFMHSYWGVVPFYKLNELKFPRLKYLSLGNYVLAHEVQINWITSLSSLETLILDDCAIAIFLAYHRNFKHSLNIVSNEWIEVPRKDDKSSDYRYKVDVRWDQYFDRLANSLKRLRRFVFGSGEWHRRAHITLEGRDDLEQDYLTATRYVAFRASYTNSDWVEPEFAPTDDEEFNARLRRIFSKDVDETQIPAILPQVVQRDQHSLEKFISVIEARRGTTSITEKAT